MTNILEAQKELKPLETEIVSFKEKVEALSITSDEEYNEAMKLAGIIKSKEDETEKMRKFFTAPLNKQVDDINAMFMPKVKEAKEIVSIIKSKMASYNEKKEADARAEQKRLDDIRAKADLKRQEQGKEAIATPVREVAPVAKTVVSDGIQSTVKKVWTHEILSINELPDDVKKAIFAEAFNKGIIKTVVQKFVNAGIREMTGVKIYQESQIALKRG
jgi:hypothetical protein